jgi:pantoate--beta-alanine ligase
LETLISRDDIVGFRASLGSEVVAFVPTMGALHAGHLKLVEVAKAENKIVLASIFVNPMQFGPSEDFAKYPRTLSDDLGLLRDHGVDGVFLPNAATIYPDGFQTVVSNSDMAKLHCGVSRPGHFDGVLTVVLKLFNLVRPHRAYFGKKDYQQFRLISKMVDDLNIGIDIKGVDTVRESDGLALSSRNRYLSVEEREKSPAIYRALSAARDSYVSGERDPAKICEVFFATVEKLGKFFELDYLNVCQQTNLSSFDSSIDAPAVILFAARLPSARLIDNIELNP